MAEKPKIKIVPNMSLYKHKGFMLFNVVKVNNTTEQIQLQKIFSDEPEEAMTLEQLYDDIDKKRIKVLSLEETQEYLKQALEKIKITKKRIDTMSKVLEKKESQYAKFKRRVSEFERNSLRP